MGGRLARTLVDTGHSVTVWSRTSERTRPLVAPGAIGATALTDAGDENALILLSGAATLDPATSPVEPVGKVIWPNGNNAIWFGSSSQGKGLVMIGSTPGYRLLSTAIAIVILIQLNALDLAAQSSASSGTIRAKLVNVMDNNGFARPLVAFSILVPETWRPEGGVVWGGGYSHCGGMGYNFQWRAIAPDGRSGVAVVPTSNWRYNTSGAASSDGCPNTPITTAGEYLQAMVQQYRPNARILDYRPRQDLAAEFQQLNSITPMPLGEQRNWVDAGEVLLAYTNNGVDTRETISAVVTFSLMRFYASDGLPGADYLSGASFPGFAAFAPAGQLDFQLTEAMRKSARPGAEWARLIAQHHAKISGIAIKGAADRAAITRDYYNDINKIQAESWKNYNESSDRMHREATESIRGVETYNDPYHGGTVELDNSYENAWQLDDGTYVLTNDPSFEPYRVYGQGGQRLEVTE